MLRALHEADLGQAELGLVVLRVLGERPLVGGGRRGEVAALDGVERLRVQRGQLVVVGARDALELDPPGDAVLHRRLEQLVEHRPHLALGLQAGEERHRLALEQPERRGDARLAERLHEQGLEGLEQLGRAREVGAEHEDRRPSSVAATRTTVSSSSRVCG